MCAAPPLAFMPTTSVMRGHEGGLRKFRMNSRFPSAPYVMGNATHEGMKVSGGLSKV